MKRGALFLALALAAGCGQSPASAPRASAPARAAARPAYELAIDGVSVQSTDASLDSARVIRRKRTGAGGLLTYHDLKELVLSNARLTLRADPARAFSIAHLVDRAKRIAALAGRGADGRAEPVSRLLFTDLSVRIHGGPDGDSELTAQRARLALESDLLVLEGGALLVTPRGERLSANLAVLSARHDGVLLPRGYRLGDREVQKPSFLALDETGSLAAAAVPAIEYADYIESREGMAIAHFVEHVPMELRPLLLAVLARQAAAPGPLR